MTLYAYQPRPSLPPYPEIGDRVRVMFGIDTSKREEVGRVVRHVTASLFEVRFEDGRTGLYTQEGILE